MILHNFLAQLLMATIGVGQGALASSNLSQCLSTADFEWPSQYVRYGEASIRVIVQGHGPAVVILPSYGRDGGADFNYFSNALVQAGYKVLRPQPRGTLGSTGPMKNVTVADFAGEVATVIDVLAAGRAIVLGHAYGHFIARSAASSYPEKIPAIIEASAQAQSNVPADVSNAPFVAGDPSLPLSTRLEALQRAFFAPGHDARVWLTGWYPATLAMQRAAIQASGGKVAGPCGGSETQVLDLIPAEDAFRPKGTWNQTVNACPDSASVKVVEDAGHALFPEQSQAVVEAVLPWLKQQSARL